MCRKYADDFAVGIIDNDKRRPGYLDEFSLLARSEHLTLYKHPIRHHYIVTVSPAVEVFVLDVVKVSGLTMLKYDLPLSLQGIKRITKHIITNKDPRLVNLFHDLSAVGECALLKKVLEYLLDHPYKASDNELCGFFSFAPDTVEKTVRDNARNIKLF